METAEGSAVVASTVETQGAANGPQTSSSIGTAFEFVCEFVSTGLRIRVDGNRPRICVRVATDGMATDRMATDRVTTDRK